MEEALWDRLYTVAKVLKFLGHADEATAIEMIAITMKDSGVDDLKKLDDWIDSHE